MPQIVWFFAKPTIGYCKDCDKIAIYDDVRGLHCPKCKTKNISLFEWDGESASPE